MVRDPVSCRYHGCANAETVAGEVALKQTASNEASQSKLPEKKSDCPEVEIGDPLHYPR